MATLDIAFAAISPADPLPSLEVGVVHIWRVPILSPVADCDEILSAAELARAVRFTHEGARRTFRHARTALRLILARYLDMPPGQIQLAIGEKGKPCLDLPSAPQFNLSHSGDLALIAVTKVAEVGIDIEVIRPVGQIKRIAATHFAPGEIATLAGLPEHERTDAFHACWTRKEAFVKTRGSGLSMPLDGFEVAIAPDAPAALLTIGGRPEAAASYTLHAFRPAADAWASVCIAAPHYLVKGFALAGAGA